MTLADVYEQTAGRWLLLSLMAYPSMHRQKNAIGRQMGVSIPGMCPAQPRLDVTAAPMHVPYPRYVNCRLLDRAKVSGWTLWVLDSVGCCSDHGMPLIGTPCYYLDSQVGEAYQRGGLQLLVVYKLVQALASLLHLVMAHDVALCLCAAECAAIVCLVSRCMQLATYHTANSATPKPATARKS